MTATPDQRAERTVGLGRVLKPSTIAVVGLKDGSPFLGALSPLLQSDADVVLVNPSHREVAGRATVPSLTDIGRPVDAVLCLTSAAVATNVIEEAATLDVGGVVLVSGGYAETGPEGAELERRIQSAADSSGMHVVGPNGLGLVNVTHGVNLSIAAPYERRSGGISVISQSGALLTGVSMAAWGRPQVGLNLLVSAGNEAVTDLADYVDYLASDPETTAIGLVVEKIRRPQEFFAAARRALAAGKPIVALKLARSARTQELAASHTGAMTGDAWVYDVAFRQVGIGIAHDPDELVDRLALLQQLDEKFWAPVENLAIVTATGGYASLSMDIATEEGVHVPPLDDFRDWVSQRIPGVKVPNPLDATGFGFRLWDEILDKYATSADVDAVLFVHPLGDADDGGGTAAKFADYVAAATRYGKPFIASNCSGPLGEWAQALVAGSPAAAVGNGPRAAIRGLASMGEFVRRREGIALTGPDAVPVPRPAATPVPQPEGPMLPFAASMELLREHGIPVARYHLIASDQAPTLPNFAGPYVVKLADVGHRTEHGAVLLGVTPAGLPDAVKQLRAIAERDALAPTVAVQPMVTARGEAFLGVQSTELGPMVVFGLGGVFVEVLRRIGGRMAPLTRSEAEELIAEFEDAKVMHGFRGEAPWDLEGLADILVSAGRFAARAGDWLSSLDVNPLLVTDDGFLAVDALCLVNQPDGQ